MDMDMGLTFHRLGNHVTKTVHNSLKDNDSPQPTMDQIERVKRNPQQLYQRIVPPSEQEQRHHIDDRQCSSPIPHLAEHCRFIRTPLDHEGAKHDIRHQIPQQEGGLEPRGQSPYIDGTRKLELAVVSHAEER
jgi:hypothetical protein